jgi:hypothetical protein
MRVLHQKHCTNTCPPKPIVGTTIDGTLTRLGRRAPAAGDHTPALYSIQCLAQDNQAGYMRTNARDNYVKISDNRKEAKYKELSMRFMKKNRKTVNLVGNEKLKASASVKHLAFPCIKPARAQAIPNTIKRNSHGGRTIIFTKTKDTASQLAAFRGHDFSNVQ